MRQLGQLHASIHRDSTSPPGTIFAAVRSTYVNNESHVLLLLLLPSNCTVICRCIATGTTGEVIREIKHT